MSWLSDLIFGIRSVLWEGVEQTERGAIDFRGMVSVADNPTTGATTITVKPADGTIVGQALTWNGTAWAAASPGASAGMANAITDGGCHADGLSADDAHLTTLQATLSATRGIHFPPGTYLISNSITLTCPLAIDPGAAFLIASGKVLTITGSIFAASDQVVFGGAGTAQLSTTGTVSPHWWSGTTTVTASANFALRWAAMWAASPYASRIELASDVLTTSAISASAWVPIADTKSRTIDLCEHSITLDGFMIGAVLFELGNSTDVTLCNGSLLTGTRYIGYGLGLNGAARIDLEDVTVQGAFVNSSTRMLGATDVQATDCVFYNTRALKGCSSIHITVDGSSNPCRRLGFEDCEFTANAFGAPSGSTLGAVVLDRVLGCRFSGTTRVNGGGIAGVYVDTSAGACGGIDFAALAIGDYGTSHPVNGVCVTGANNVNGLSVHALISSTAATAGLYVLDAASAHGIRWCTQAPSGARGVVLSDAGEAMALSGLDFDVGPGIVVDMSAVTDSTSSVTGKITCQDSTTDYLLLPADAVSYLLQVTSTDPAGGIVLCESNGTVASTRSL